MLANSQIDREASDALGVQIPLFKSAHDRYAWLRLQPSTVRSGYTSYVRRKANAARWRRPATVTAPTPATIDLSDPTQAIEHSGRMDTIRAHAACGSTLAEASLEMGLPEQRILLEIEADYRGLGWDAFVRHTRALKRIKRRMLLEQRVQWLIEQSPMVMLAKFYGELQKQGVLDLPREEDLSQIPTEVLRERVKRLVATVERPKPFVSGLPVTCHVEDREGSSTPIGQMPEKKRLELAVEPTTQNELLIEQVKPATQQEETKALDPPPIIYTPPGDEKPRGPVISRPEAGMLRL